MILTTNKAMYAPGERVQLTVTDLPEGTAALSLRAWHLATEIASACFFLPPEPVIWSAPDTDFQGYLLEISALDTSNKRLTRAQIAVDVSSTWTKFPRYGYVWDFTQDAPAAEKIAAMNRFHLNGVQYYDWQYRHHRPLSDDPTMWSDWSGRRIYGDVLRAYLASAHAHGMVNMAYNMIYAANQTYLDDGSGVDAAWRLIKQDGQDFAITMNETGGSTSILQYFNPLNKDWQRYLFARENEVFAAFAFDGWHGDTIGENGPMTTAAGGPLGYDTQGQPIHFVKDCYRSFLNSAKAAIGDKYLVFNPVGAQGMEQVNTSAVDVLYAEFWPWDSNDAGEKYDDYYTLHREILRAAAQSGGKSLVIAGYINYRHPAPHFNPPAVLLMAAVCFASGGARIELGNGANMLSDEYFPSDVHKTMGAQLQAQVQRWYDFIVAYENLLRDGQTNLNARLEMDVPYSALGESDKVWGFARADAAYIVVHFINLTGTDNDWRDTEQRKPAPQTLADMRVRLYTDRSISQVCLASPDRDDLTPLPLPFIGGMDAQGAYIEWVMPALTYWNMIFMR